MRPLSAIPPRAAHWKAQGRAQWGLRAFLAPPDRPAGLVQPALQPGHCHSQLLKKGDLINNYTRLMWLVRWHMAKNALHNLDMMTSRGHWIWLGHLGISFLRFPRFSFSFKVKRGQMKGILIGQFGPLLFTAPWSRSSCLKSRQA